MLKNLLFLAVSDTTENWTFTWQNCSMNQFCVLISPRKL